MRREDRRLVTGSGRFVADLSLPNQAHAVVVRSPHAHARILAIDSSAAVKVPGVIAVLTAQHAKGDGLRPIPTNAKPSDSRGKGLAPPCPLLAAERVRFVGEAVALVVAESDSAAQEASERIEIAFETLPAVAEPLEAVRPDAPVIWPEAPDNLCFLWEVGDPQGVAAAFAGASHVTHRRFVNNRVHAAYLEPRGALGSYDAGRERYTLYTNSQVPHLLRRQLAEDVLGVAGHQVRIVIPDVGGAFGAKGPVYPEQALVLWASRRVGRPVKWVASRTESFLADTHGRDNLTEAELALDSSGGFLALRVRIFANIGAYVTTHGAYVPVSSLPLFASVYRTPALSIEVRGTFTNTVPTDAYRGAGRPEVVYIVERLIDAAAVEMGLDQVEIRQRNMITPQDMPYRTPLGWTYDAGDFPSRLRQAIASADYGGFEARRKDSRKRGRLRGFGLANHIDRAAGGGLEEFSEVRFDPTGSVMVFSGTMASGQGHETAFALLVSEALGIPPDCVRIVQGDTDQVSLGTGTFGSRSLVVGGSAMLRAAERVILKARTIAAHQLEVAEADLEFEAGRFRILGSDRELSIQEIARSAFAVGNLPPGMETGLEASATFRPVNFTFSNGCHACEIEIDPETGELHVERYVAADDYGRLLVPQIVEGQLIGGIAQGIGQALLEQIRHDGEGQLLTASFLDYAVPRADNLPFISLEFGGEAAGTNPIGVKGCGESGTIAAPPAVINAVIDALAPVGVRDIDMPATPERIWRAIRSAAAD